MATYDNAPAAVREAKGDAVALPDRRALMDSATRATLAKTAASLEADALVERLLGLVESHERHPLTTARRRPLAVAAAAFAADLLSTPPGAYIYRSLNTNSFTRQTVGYRPFVALVEAWEAAGLLEVARGFNLAGGRGRAARFRATPAMILLAEAAGIERGDTWGHFRRRDGEPEAQGIVLRSQSGWTARGKVRGECLPVPDNADTRRLAGELAAINAFMRGVHVGGATHREFFRGFSYGDLETFAWNKGGRLYSSGPGNYQQAKQATRLAMTLDGETVVEIDLKASALTIAHGLAGEHYRPGADAYDALGFEHRDLVKAWTNASLTQGRALSKWPQKQAREYALKHPGQPLEEVCAAVSILTAMTEKHPLLGRLEGLPFDWADLMFAESTAVVRTMLALVAEAIPSLPVHDSLIVPASAAMVAQQLLKTHFKEVTGLSPALKMLSADLSTVTL